MRWLKCSNCGHLFVSLFLFESGRGRVLKPTNIAASLKYHATDTRQDSPPSHSISILTTGYSVMFPSSAFLTHLCLASHKRETVKQCRPRSDAAEGGV